MTMIPMMQSRPKSKVIASNGKELTVKVHNALKKEDKMEIITKKKNIPIRIGVNSGSLEQDILKRHGHPSPQATPAKIATTAGTHMLIASGKIEHLALFHRLRGRRRLALH